MGIGTPKHRNTPFIGSMSFYKTNVNSLIKKKSRRKPIKFAATWRRHPDLNWGIRELQSHALPLGYSAILERVTRLELTTAPHKSYAFAGTPHLIIK
jgi:hypothetical protein